MRKIDWVRMRKPLAARADRVRRQLRDLGRVSEDTNNKVEVLRGHLVLQLETLLEGARAMKQLAHARRR